MLKIDIAHIYPEAFNVSGDNGNIISFMQRCKWRNINVEIHDILLGQDIKPVGYNLYYISGSEHQRNYIAENLLKQKNNLKEAVENNAVILSVNAGYQLLGKYCKSTLGDKIQGVEIFDAYTLEGHTDCSGNVTMHTDVINSKLNSIVGYENHKDKTYLEDKVRPFGIVSTGNGNNGKDKTEGAVYKNVYGSYIISVLPKNPYFCDHLIKLILQRKYKLHKLKELDDNIEMSAHNLALDKKY